ncbi:unnamed protein product [Cuscuta europaea]|uniref:GUN4-like domain-containing protein n=1 Tax=Cuscuta europaea TaxID=41803 RepID=A0A9P0ZFV4_CUSEU|nr:unnamed protein product [Cuscuta europaea]
MATNPLKSINHHHHCHPFTLRRHPLSDSSSFLKPTTRTAGAVSSAALPRGIFNFNLSPATPTTTVTPPSPPPQTSVSYDLLERHLAAQNFRQADEETRRLLIALAGDAAQERGYVFFSEVQFIPDSDLRQIDSLWRKHSNGRFGYSVQKKIWKKVNGDFTDLFKKIGWMKKLETEIEQYNYRAFPDEFNWELGDEVPEGHLPLTNALRGVQLLSYILKHPAFEEEEEEGNNLSSVNSAASEGGIGLGLKKISTFKPDYSF